jgi:hypothetical protein
VAALFLHNGGICVFIPTSGADKEHKCQSSIGEGEQKTARFFVFGSTKTDRFEFEFSKKIENFK